MSMDKLSQVESWRGKRKVGQLQCERCGFCWYPRPPKSKPVACPSCHSRIWEKPLGRDFLLIDDKLKAGHERGIKVRADKPGREFLGGAK